MTLQTDFTDTSFSNVPIAPAFLTSTLKNAIIASKQSEIVQRVSEIIPHTMQSLPDASNYIFHLNQKAWNSLCQKIFTNAQEITPEDVKDFFEMQAINSQKEILKETLVNLCNSKLQRLKEEDWKKVHQLVFKNAPWVSLHKTKDLYEQSMISLQKEGLYHAIALKLAEKLDPKVPSRTLEDQDWDKICSQFFSLEITIDGVKKFYRTNKATPPQLRT
jgi:cell division septum initiation protein DivIVA